MREILFRGKRVDNGEWGEGYYVYMKKSESHRIYTGDCHIYTDKDTGWWTITPTFYKVIPSTVGQFTGLTDKNGKKIFIDDIVEAKRPPCIQRGVVTQLSDGLFVFKGEKYHDLIDFKLEDVNLERCLSVIGNIHDDPELLEVEE